MTILNDWLNDIPGPHARQALHTSGTPVGEASAAVVMMHGRGASAASILELARLLDSPGVAHLAPQAAASTWYPYSFLEARDLNEPGLSSAHAVLGQIIKRLGQHGISPDRIVLLGFSQGACLATDHAAANPRRYGGVVGLSGGLIGDQVVPSSYSGSLDRTPIFLGCSDIDPHIPESRVHETGRIFEQLHSDVTTTIYPGMGHTVNQDEIAQARRIISEVGQI